jgi:SAM-dependent methyltransferase
LSRRATRIGKETMAGSEGVFDISAGVFDLLYRDKDTVQEVEWIRSFLKAQEKETDFSILEIGAGTGRHARAFGDLGFSITAVEPSQQMLERASPHPRVKFLEGNGRSLRIDKKFDAILALFHVVSYQTSLSDVSEFFETASHHLKTGGVFGFDVWYSPAVLFQRPERRILTKEDNQLRVTREAIPSEDVQNSHVDVHYTYTVEELSSGEVSNFEEIHSMRHFTQGEIQLVADSHGFEIVDAREFMSDREPSRDTWGVWFTLQKV